MKYENIAVLGAGTGGLTAALRIAETGRDVTVVDTKIDPQTPLPTATRLTLLYAKTVTLARLGVSMTRYPEYKYVITGDGLTDFEELAPGDRERGIDALSLRKTLLQQARKHPQIELVKGKATKLHVDTLGERSRVTAVTVKDGREESVLEMGNNGLVVVATGIDNNLHDGQIIMEIDLPSHQGQRTLGGYIRSPELDNQSREFARIQKVNGRPATLAPSERIEPGGTNYATFFMVDKKTLDAARGGSASALSVMQELTRGSSWEQYFRDATVDRVLLYTDPGNTVRMPSVAGAVLVGDARITLDPANGSGIARIDGDTRRLQEYIRETSDLTKAGEVYNATYPPIIIN